MEAWRNIMPRAKAIGRPETIGHTLPATGITAYRKNGGSIDVGEPYHLVELFYLGVT